MLEGTSPDVPKIFGSAGALPSRKTTRYSPFATRCRFGSAGASPSHSFRPASHAPRPVLIQRSVSASSTTSDLLQNFLSVKFGWRRRFGALTQNLPDPKAINEAAEIIRKGGLVAFPTETVYGLGANALDETAVRKIFAAKERPAWDPLIVHICDLTMLDWIVEDVPEKFSELASRFMPGPLTVVMRKKPIVPDAVTAGLPTVAVRMPNHPVALALIEAAGVPIAAPSANRFGRPSPTTAEHVLQDLAGRIDGILDAGPTQVGVGINSH